MKPHLSFLAMLALFGSICVESPTATAQSQLTLVQSVSPSGSILLTISGLGLPCSTTGQTNVAIALSVITISTTTIGGDGCFSTPPPSPPINITVDVGPLAAGHYFVTWLFPAALPPTSIEFDVTAAASQTVAISQLPNGHIIANVSGLLEEACLSHPTYTLPSSPGEFDLFTDVSCGPTTPLKPYAASVDLGVVTDGHYTVIWAFLAGALGPCCGTASQPFSIRNGALVGNAAAPIPSLASYALMLLALLIGLTAFGHFRALRVPRLNAR